MRPRFSLALLSTVALLSVASACKKDPTSPGIPTTTTFTCADSASGANVACTLDLHSAPGFTVTLDSVSCRTHGNTITITSPIDSLLLADGCYAAVPTSWVFPGPFPPSTQVAMSVSSNRHGTPPQLRVSGSYPIWQAHFEDGGDSDFNDLNMTIRADSIP